MMHAKLNSKIEGKGPRTCQLRVKYFYAHGKPPKGKKTPKTVWLIQRVFRREKLVAESPACEFHIHNGVVGNLVSSPLINPFLEEVRDREADGGRKNINFVYDAEVTTS